jgi:heme/copper-type cytochrome/quinol oxidase subunit 2
MNFQNPATPIARGIQELHHDIMFFIIVIAIFTFWMLGRTLWFFETSKNPKPSLIVHGVLLEIVWTVVPSLILLVLAVPSFALLYSMDEVVHPAMTLKVTGNQWYWNYEYTDSSTETFEKEADLLVEVNVEEVQEEKETERVEDEKEIVEKPVVENKSKLIHFIERVGEHEHYVNTGMFLDKDDESVVEVKPKAELPEKKKSPAPVEISTKWESMKDELPKVQSARRTINFDSYMIPEDELEMGQLRLLEVDNRVVLPVKTHIRLLITGRDVIHNWAIPSLGVKCDGLPGRLNQANLFIDRVGVYYGQCSELCGVLHGFMPIVVEAVTLEDYLAWNLAELEPIDNHKRSSEMAKKLSDAMRG